MNVKLLFINTFFVIIFFIGNQLTSQAIAQPDSCISDIQVAEIHETSLHYIDCGEGEPVVLVHGSLGDYRTWVGQIGPFSEDFRVISYSRRYHYPNPWPQDALNYKVDIHAEDLAAFIRSLEVGAVHLIGHSYGAFTSLLVARDYPELVQTLTLGEPPVMSLLVSSPQGKSAFKNFIKNAINPSHSAFQNGEIEEGVRLFINGVLGEGAYGDLPAVAHFSMLENAKEMMGEINGMNTEGVDFFPAFSCNDAKNLTMPTLLLEGEKSPEMFGLINNKLERCIPNNKLGLIPEASHGLEYENPQAFNREVLQFLETY